MLLLVKVAKALKAGKTYEDVKKNAMLVVEQEFQSAGLLDKTPQHDAGHKVIKTLLESPTKSIPFSKMNELVPDPSMKEELLKHNVFAYHPATHTLSFQSRSVETYAHTHFLR